MGIGKKCILLFIWQACDEADKSTEWMIQEMQDRTGLDTGQVVDFINKTGDTERKEFCDFLKFIESIED